MTQDIPPLPAHSQPLVTFWLYLEGRVTSQGLAQLGCRTPSVGQRRPMPGSLKTSHQNSILTLTPETPGSLLGLLTEEA